MNLNKNTVFQSYPQIDGGTVDLALAKEIAKSPRKIIVLDDDPTGTQTVHDVSVYTDWSRSSLRAGFLEENKLFYILTNSRALSQKETTRIHREIADGAIAVSRELGIPFLIVSRSDSTLRGHYPLETQVLAQRLALQGQPIDGEILCPFFYAGGRFTVGNIHYVLQGEDLVPAAETEFAADKTFGYTHSDLPGYIQEKTAGAYPADSVVCISLEQLRAMDYEGITRQLMSVTGFGKVCVNAIGPVDVKVFCVALYRAMAAGKHFLFRTAADFVKAVGGISDQPLLTRQQLIPRPTQMGGVVVVGSHTQKTTEQLQRLLTSDRAVGIEFNSDLVLQGDGALQAEVQRCVALEEEIIRSGKTAVCYTNRKLLSLPDDTKEQALARSVKIGEAVHHLVGDLSVTPSFVISKGGITSSDVAVKALRLHRATVLGQICPGIPAWQTPEDSRFPGIAYIIFPGNTGSADTLRQAVDILQGQ